VHILLRTTKARALKDVLGLEKIFRKHAENIKVPVPHVRFLILIVMKNRNNDGFYALKSHSGKPCKKRKSCYELWKSALNAVA